MSKNLFKTSQERVEALRKGIEIKDIERVYVKNNGLKINNACLLHETVNDSKEKKKMQSKYVLHQTEKSFCPDCGSQVHLLISDEDTHLKPAFYICFFCQFIGEVGVSPVAKGIHAHKKIKRGNYHGTNTKY